MLFKKKQLFFLLIIVVAVTASVVCVLLTKPQWLPWNGQVDSHVLLVSGNIEAHESVLSFKTVQSRIISLPFDEGQWAHKGQVLAVVDSSDYQKQLDIAEATLAVQQRQLDIAEQSLVTAGRTVQVDQAEVRQRQLDRQRASDLQQKGFVSSASLDQTDTALQEANAVLLRDQSQQSTAARNIAEARAAAHNAAEAVDMARLVLAYTTLRAPLAGGVTVRTADLGELVVPGTPILTLADLDHVWLRAYINETDLGRVRLNQPVAVTSDSHPGKRYLGHVSFISDEAEFTPKSVETYEERVTLVYRIKIDLANPDHELVTGMPVDGRIDLSAKAM